MKIHRAIPNLVRTLCWGFDAWVVGSAAKALALNKEIQNDWDVIVPFENWNRAAGVIHLWHVTANSFGGWKLTLDKDTVDVWPDTLDRFFQRAQKTLETKWAIHPKSGMVVRADYNFTETD